MYIKSIIIASSVFIAIKLIGIIKYILTYLLWFKLYNDRCRYWYKKYTGKYFKYALTVQLFC